MTTPNKETLAGAAPSKPSEAEPLPPAPARVAAPEGVFFRARVTAPLLVVDRAMEAAGLPLRAQDLLDVLEDDAELLLSQDIVDFSGSFEAVLALEPGDRIDRSPKLAISAGIRSLRRALSALDQRSIQATQGPGGIHYFAHEKAHCALGRSLGSSPYRLVCSDQSESLSALLGYALAGLSTETRGTPDWFEIDLKPVRAKYGGRAKGLKLLASVGARQLHKDHPRFDRAVTEAAVALAEEAGDLLADTDLVLGEFRQSERGDLRFDLKLEFGQVSSWYALALGDLVAMERRPPPAFLDLPASSSAASYSVGLPEERMGKMRRIAVDLAAGALEWKGAPASLVRDVEVVIEESLTPSELVVQASGPTGLDSKGHLVPSWGLYQVSRPREMIVSALESAARVSTSSYWKTLDPKLDRAFVLKRTKDKLSRAPRAAVYSFEISKAALKELNELESSRGNLGKSGPNWGEMEAKGYLAVDTLGSETALVYAKDKVGLEAAFAELGRAPKLGELAELKPFFAEPKAAAGFARVAGFVGLYALVLPEALMTKIVKGLERTPNGGQASFFFSTGGARQGTRLTFSSQYDVSAAFIGDVAALIGFAVAEMKKE